MAYHPDEPTGHVAHACPRCGEGTVPLCMYRQIETAAPTLGLVGNGQVIDLGANGGPASMAEALRMPAAELRTRVEEAQRGGTAQPIADDAFAAPIDLQEVWASGVTYLRSRDARMEESTQKSVYDLVYDAERPELFAKGTARRVAGPGEAVAIRSDSTWDVPEPELVLAINTAGEIVGYSVGNDVSSRSIEGENPLYLPQAKVYDKCAGLGPVVALAWEVPKPRSLAIKLIIRRDGQEAFVGETSTNQIHRSFDELVTFLLRDNSFPDGVFLMTGTGIVPPSEFTLEHGDEVEIAIEDVGVLRNPVIRHGRT